MQVDVHEGRLVEKLGSQGDALLELVEEEPLVDHERTKPPALPVLEIADHECRQVRVVRTPKSLEQGHEEVLVEVAGDQELERRVAEAVKSSRVVRQRPRCQCGSRQQGRVEARR